MRRRHTGSEVGGGKDGAERLGEAVAVGVAKDDGDVVDGLDVVLSQDGGLDGGAGGDGLWNSDADDAGVGDGQEGGDSGDVEEHLEDCWLLVVLKK